MKYRSEIDGLRALAIIPVILFHADFTVFSGGYVGVDIFFAARLKASCKRHASQYRCAGSASALAVIGRGLNLALVG